MENDNYFNDAVNVSQFGQNHITANDISNQKIAELMNNPEYRQRLFESILRERNPNLNPNIYKSNPPEFVYNQKSVNPPEFIYNQKSVRNPNVMTEGYKRLDGISQMDEYLKRDLSDKFRNSVNSSINERNGLFGMSIGSNPFNPINGSIIGMYLGDKLWDYVQEKDRNARLRNESHAMDLRYSRQPENLSTVLRDYEEYKKFRDLQLAKDSYEQRMKQKEDERASRSAEAFWKESERRRKEGIGPVPLDWKPQ